MKIFGYDPEKSRLDAAVKRESLVLSGQLTSGDIDLIFHANDSGIASIEAKLIDKQRRINLLQKLSISVGVMATACAAFIYYQNSSLDKALETKHVLEVATAIDSGLPSDGFESVDISGDPTFINYPDEVAIGKMILSQSDSTAFTDLAVAERPGCVIRNVTLKYVSNDSTTAVAGFTSYETDGTELNYSSFKDLQAKLGLDPCKDVVLNS